MLLDTNVLIWWLGADPRAAPLIPLLMAQPTKIRVSLISLWEIMIKVRIGKLRLNHDWILEQIDIAGWRLLPLDMSHFRALASLPSYHRDPFDHLLIAQAMAEGLTLVTGDRATPLYPVATHHCPT
jgi:PIN domain nuclease of toxin-antitoxin system